MKRELGIEAHFVCVSCAGAAPATVTGEYLFHMPLDSHLGRRSIDVDPGARRPAAHCRSIVQAGELYGDRGFLA